MGDFALTIYVFVASSMDTKPERDLVKRVVTDLNSRSPVSNEEQFLLVPILWEDEALGSSLAPQDAINRNLRRPSECQLCIFLFRARFGSPVFVEGNTYDSGVMWEYNDAKNSRAERLVYRRNMSGHTITIGHNSDYRDAQQWVKLVEFFNKEFFDAAGTMTLNFTTYNDESDLERALMRDILGKAQSIWRNSDNYIALRVIGFLKSRDASVGARRDEIRDFLKDNPPPDDSDLESRLDSAIGKLQREDYVRCHGIRFFLSQTTTSN